MRNSLLAGIAAAALVVGTAQNASAVAITPALTTSLSVISDSNIGSGSLGTITVTNVSGGVTVNVALNSNIRFVETGGPHTAFAFNLDKAYTSITNLSPSVYNTLLSNAGATPYGTFSVGLECGSCRNGGAGAVAGPLSFTVNGVTAANFVSNSSGYIFAADLLNTSNGSTGSVANGTVTRTTTPPPPVAVPEPASLALFGAGLFGLGMVRRRRKQA